MQNNLLLGFYGAVISVFQSEIETIHIWVVLQVCECYGMKVSNDENKVAMAGKEAQNVDSK